jgi:hypothetical protein
MSKPKYETREEWLVAAVDAMRPLFKSHEYVIPALRVTCGWPSSRALSRKKRCLGECWSKESSTDKKPQIFISPYLDEAASDTGVLATLVHEVVHAVVGNKEGHNKVFGKCARAVGLEGKLTSTNAGEELVSAMEDWSKSLGEYPHARLDLLKRPTKKQTTRMVKCECGTCGYTVRTSRKWLEETGAPICPCNKKSMGFEIPDELDSDDGGGDE